MSNVLEEGEIDSEHEALLDFNNESVIDEIVEKENGSQKKESSRENRNNSNNSIERKRKRGSGRNSRRSNAPRDSTSTSSWRSINSPGNPDRLRRAPDSVIFPGMQNSPIHSRTPQSFYPAAQQPPTFSFFNPPPPPPLLQFAGPPPPPNYAQRQSTELNGSYRGGNLDDVRMEIDRRTPDEPMLPPRSSNPVDIPLMAIPPPPPPPVLQDDADALRQMLLSQMTLKRGGSQMKASASKRKKSRSISKTADPKENEAGPAPAPAPISAAQSSPPTPQPEAQTSLEKQTELGAQIQKLESFIKESQSSIRQEHEELKQITARCKFLKESMDKRRIEIKEAAVKKRDFQRQLEALDEEELDILCDDIIFERMFRPATAPAMPVKTAKSEEPEQVAPLAPPAPPAARHQNSVDAVNDEEPQDISSAEDSVEDPEDPEDRADEQEEVEEEAEGEDEEEEEEEIEVVVPAPNSGLNEELSLREKLLAKCARSRQSPDVSAVVTSSSPSVRALSCKNMILKLCKFELNGTCTRGRECSFVHLVDITDPSDQRMMFEGLLRDVLGYRESDIDTAISEVFAFLPRFEHFEKLMQYFLSIVMQRTPDFRTRLFEFFASARQTPS